MFAVRAGKFDALIGINLLREGLDIPEVVLVAVLDADKEGFLRSTRSLIQTFGRAARNVKGKVILYADTVTASMAQAIEETEKRRRKQQEYNHRHAITPQSIRKAVGSIFGLLDQPPGLPDVTVAEPAVEYANAQSFEESIQQLEQEMDRAAKDLEFEKAIELRDRIKSLKQHLLFAS